MSVKERLAEFQPRNDTLRNVVLLNDASNAPANLHARPGEGRGIGWGEAGGAEGQKETTDQIVIG